MPTVVIKSINRQDQLTDEKFEWLKENLNKPLPLSGIDYWRNGGISHIVIYKGDDDIVVLFNSIYGNDFTFSLRNVRGK